MVSHMNLLLLAAETADEITWPEAFVIVAPMAFIVLIIWLAMRD